MENKNNYKEERFDSFLNKTIILSSRTYFKKQMNIINKENTILNNENFSTFLQGFIDTNCPCSDIYDVESRLELNTALSCLSDIEQAVIFLLFHEELSQSEAAEILEKDFQKAFQKGYSPKDICIILKNAGIIIPAYLIKKFLKVWFGIIKNKYNSH